MVSIRNNLKENPQTSPSRSARPPACGRASLPAGRQVGILSKINRGFWVEVYWKKCAFW